MQKAINFKRHQFVNTLFLYKVLVVMYAEEDTETLKIASYLCIYKTHKSYQYRLSALHWYVPANG